MFVHFNRNSVEFTLPLVLHFHQIEILTSFLVGQAAALAEEQRLLAVCSAAVAQGGVMAETDELLQTFNDLGFAVANGRA
jgi:hypothetical protein